MLGLGAVFPAIIAEQRDAFAAIEGENAAASAAALLQNPEMIDFQLLGNSFGKRTNAVDELYLFDWVVPPFGRNFYGWSTPVPGYYQDFATYQSAEFSGSQSGIWSFNANGSFGDVTLPGGANLTTYRQLTELPVHSRLFPQPSSGKEPKYVWDVALRRSPIGDRIQAAIFVRRVDARVRVPRGSNLSDVLRGIPADGNGFDEDSFRLPVALDLANQARPAADDGSNSRVYANIQMLEVEVYEDHLDWLVFTPNGIVDNSINLATRPGQMLVDNTGVIRTVIGIVNPGTDPDIPNASDKVIVAVDPPFQFSNAGGSDTDDVRPDRNTTLGNGLENERSKRATWVRQVIFTPREPVAVKIVTIGGES
jgi:hypothetical protein